MFFRNSNSKCFMELLYSFQRGRLKPDVITKDGHSFGSHVMPESVSCTESRYIQVGQFKHGSTCELP